MIRNTCLLVCFYICSSTCVVVNIASTSNISASPSVSYEHYTYDKEHAIDGKTGTYNDDCNCCYCADVYTPAFFMMTLPGIYNVTKIVIEGKRPAGNSPLPPGLTVYIDNTTFPNIIENRENNTVYITPNTSIQTIRVEKKTSTTNYLYICEIRVFVQACLDGFYGDQCNKPCGYCREARECDRVTGHCRDGCEAGFEGDTCTSMCNDGYFGLDCVNACHCMNGEVCNKTTGHCKNGCAAGWKGNNCSIACLNGQYGPDCAFDCHCMNGAACNRTTGYCASGCAAGWMGYNCSLECLNGTFGPGCLNQCHCIDGEDCNKATGHCRIGCAAGWMGDNCSTACLNGKFGRNCANDCHCIGGEACNRTTGYCASGCAAGWIGDNCSTECLNGTFGPGCLNHCHCIDGEDCNKATGHCRIGCAAGWMGDNCSTACLDTTFGPGCSNDCHCLDNLECNRYFGNCSGACDSGWTGFNCSEGCSDGKFGPDCATDCHCFNDEVCNKTTGYCIGGCAAGWMGDNCNVVCQTGHYGFKCENECHCWEDADCNNVNGKCNNDLCAPGWRNKTCNEECGHAQFGLNCSSTCYCQGNSSCFHVNGTCPIGSCVDGWQGASCSERVENQSGDSDTSSINGGAIGGGVAAAVAVLVVVAGIVFVIRRRQSRTPDKDRFSRELNPDLKVQIPASPSNTAREDKANYKSNQAYEADETDPAAYYNLSSVQANVQLSQLWFYIRKHQEDQNKLFCEEFKEVPYGLIHPYSDSQKMENKGKNRYKEMYAYDHTRVHLDITGPGETDYINASHINGHNEPKKFIAAQGPTENNLNDFWRMIWQQNISVVIMLTNPMEAGSVKCLVYWPEEEDEDVYGSVNVKITNTESQPDYIRRDMIIGMSGSKDRKLSQFHFKAWPDKDVPDSTWCLVNFWREATIQQHNSKAPILVHCSAGIGRTGTYIGLDILYNQMITEGSMQPLHAVKQLRQQRVNMVQTKDQYAYLHEAVADALSIGTHFIWSSQLVSVYKYMSKKAPNIDITGFENQYKIAIESADQVSNENCDDDVEYANISLATEMNAYRPNIRKRSSKSVQEMGAMYLPSFSGDTTFLMAKSPSGKSLVEFWSLVHEENVKTVISLCDPSSKNYLACCSLGENTETLKGTFVVEKISESKRRSCVEREFQYKEHGTDEDSVRKIRVFDFTAWKSDYNVPGDVTSLLNLLKLVFKWQPHISDSQPILVHCGTGTKRCGLVCLVMSELQRLRREDEQLNVLDSFMRMRQRNKGIITNVEQYKFCYDALMAHLGGHDTQCIYENVEL